MSVEEILRNTVVFLGVDRRSRDPQDKKMLEVRDWLKRNRTEIIRMLALYYRSGGIDETDAKVKHLEEQLAEMTRRNNAMRRNFEYRRQEIEDFHQQEKRRLLFRIETLLEYRNVRFPSETPEQLQQAARDVQAAHEIMKQRKETGNE